MEIERNNELFLNAPRPLLGTAVMDAQMKQREADGMALRTLIHMDDPQHKVVRAIGADWFRPHAMRALEERVQELARVYVDRMAEFGGECDFATQVSVHYPLYVILSLLGLPESDFPRLLKLTQEMFGGGDEELRRGETPEELLQTLLDFFTYFQELTNARRASPTGDIASAIANARVDGEHLSDFDTASYYVIIATAGHDTTSSTIAGGLHALIQHPAELARLRDNPSLLTTAADEMIRWVTPVKEFMRTAAADTEVGGVAVKEGQAVLLSYPSANRDEEVFDDPFRFDVGRDPNRHLAFGFGVHFCLGAALARLEIRQFFEAFVARVRDVRVVPGSVDLLANAFVAGLNRATVELDWV
jgi:cytochrome P450